MLLVMKTIRICPKSSVLALLFVVKSILFFFKPILQSYYLAENGKNSDNSYMELKLFADP